MSGRSNAKTVNVLVRKKGVGQTFTWSNEAGYMQLRQVTNRSKKIYSHFKAIWACKNYKIKGNLHKISCIPLLNPTFSACVWPIVLVTKYLIFVFPDILQL